MIGKWSTEGPKSHRKQLWKRKGTRNLPNPRPMQHSSLLSGNLHGKRANNFFKSWLLQLSWDWLMFSCDTFLSFLIPGRKETRTKVLAVCSVALYLWVQHLWAILFPLTKFCTINCTPHRCIGASQKIKPSKRLCASSVTQQTALRRLIHYFTFFLLQMAALLVSEAELTLFTVHRYRC